MAEVIVNVKANTKQATDNVDDLNDALDQTAVAAEKAEKELAAQEARIKTLGGAINIVGGSVEILAGALALSGAATEEQVQKFEQAAVGAIAFADGAKRVFEGYKELKEATALATKAQVANNLAVLANPYVAAAAAVAALSAGLFLLYKRTQVVITEENRREGALNAARKASDELTRSQDALNRSYEIEINGAENRIKLLKAQGASIEEIFEAERNLALAKIANAKLVLAEEERQNRELEKAVRILEETEERTGGVTASTKAMREALETNKDEVAAATTNLDDLNTELKLLKLNYGKAQREIEDNPIVLKPKVVSPSGEEEPMTISEYFRQQTGDVLATLEGAQLRANNFTKQSSATALETASANLFAYAELAEYAVGDSIAAFGEMFSALSEITGEGNEEAFEKGKKFKIAEVVTSSIQAAFAAFAAAQQYGPILGPILGAAQVAAIAVTSNRAIQDIRSSQYGGDSSTPALSTAGVSTPAGFGAGLGGGGVTVTQTNTAVPPPEAGVPMRAYVVSSDINTAQETESAMRKRRTL